MFRLELYHSIARRLKMAGIEDHEVEAGILLVHHLRIKRADIFLQGEAAVSPELVGAVEKSVARRLRRVPLSYVIGEQEFWGRRFEVSPAVLIPRQETELLVEKTIAAARQRPGARRRALELGTGSGVIGVTMALELPLWQIVTVDISARALAVAARNAKAHGVDKRLSLVNADWYHFLRPGVLFEIVVSNPPYVASSVRESLQPELAHEPELALFGGQKGTEALARIFTGLAGLLAPGGMIFIEIGYDQKEYAISLARQSGRFSKIVVHDDYAGLPRILQAQLG